MKSAKIFQKLILTALLLFCLPNITQAADANNLGKITINVRDENNNLYVGNWFMYSGSNNNGLMVRNGSGGETFNFQAGTYFIEAQPKESIRPYRLISPSNPQTLTAGGAITFNIQYFQTEDQKNNPQIPAVTTTEPAPQAPVVIAPAPQENTITSAPDTTAQDPYGRTYMGPEPVVAPVTAPATSDETSAPATVQPVRLAETGSPALLLLVFSGLLGSIVSRKKK